MSVRARSILGIIVSISFIFCAIWCKIECDNERERYIKYIHITHETMCDKCGKNIMRGKHTKPIGYEVSCGHIYCNECIRRTIQFKRERFGIQCKICKQELEQF